MRGSFYNGLIFIALLITPEAVRAQMDPYFTAINYASPRDTLMVTYLTDFQIGRFSRNFFTSMGMLEYGITPRWTAGFMAEGEKVLGQPVTYGGQRFNTYFHLLKRDRLLNFTLYAEYEHLNGAALYKMEVAGFGGEDLTEPLAVARRTPAHTFEQRAIVYHDWGRLNATFNFISETDLVSRDNDFGYAWGLFRQPRWVGMDMGSADPMAPGSEMPMSAPPFLSLARIGYGVEMIGALGSAESFGFDWPQQQQYLGPVFRYSLSRRWSFRVEPAFGLSRVSDPFVLRLGLDYSVRGLGQKMARAFRAQPKTTN